MTAAAADQLPLQIKMYTYDRLPVQLATRLSVCTRVVYGHSATANGELSPAVGAPSRG